MSTVIEGKQKELRELETIRFVTNALFEVSAESIMRLRTAFETNHLFYTDISDLYRSIKQTAISRGHIENKTVRTKERGVSVAFTSNSRFYGSINLDVMNTFFDHMKVTDRDCIVIGNTGRLFMENYSKTKKCSLLSFAGDHPTEKEMRQFLKQVMVYDQVYVFHPSFINIFNQGVSVLDITHTPQIDEGSSVAEEEQIDYIFEPELPKILHFFETRVRYLLFQRAMLESQLSRTAARLMAMSAADERAGKELKRVRSTIRRQKETFNDMQLLESFAAIKQWKR